MFTLINVYYIDGSEGSFTYSKDILNQLIMLSETLNNIVKVTLE